MRAICVAAGPPALDALLTLCRALPRFDGAEGFTRPQDALDWLERNRAALAVLDLDNLETGGLALAKAIREQSPETAIIFAASGPEYALEAIRLHIGLFGYLVKPVSMDELSGEVDCLLSGSAAGTSGNPPAPRSAGPVPVEVRTFGGFTVLADGKPVSFSRSKSKEILAYLIDRRGEKAARKEIYETIWERTDYGHSAQKQLDVYIRSLRNTLKANAIGDILELESGKLRIRPERLDCDMYRFLLRDEAAVKAYRGNYLPDYSWAEFSNAFLNFL